MNPILNTINKNNIVRKIMQTEKNLELKKVLFIFNNYY